MRACAKSAGIYSQPGVLSLVEEAYFGTDGQPALHKDGYARVTKKHDERGELLEEAYFDADGKPAIDAACSCARIALTVDERGEVTRRETFDAEGNSLEAR